MCYNDHLVNGVIMGSRIHKDIGYFINKEDANTVFVSNYRKILNDLYENANKQENFLTSLMEVTKKALPKNVIKSLTEYQIKELLKHIENKEMRIAQVLHEIYFADKYEGVLFATPSHVKDSRRDNSIDYYEERKKSELENTIYYLNEPIYPTKGYFYHGGLKEVLEEIGEVISEDLMYYAADINKEFYNNTLDIMDNMPQLLTEKGFFTPNVDPFMFVLAKAAKIIKKEVTLIEFNKLVRPAILTYWD